MRKNFAHDAGKAISGDRVAPPRTVSPVESNRGPWELAELRQFVGWKYAPNPDRPKPKKPPINPHDGKRAKPTAPETWGTYAQAQRAVTRYGLAGTGFVFTAEDPYAGVDLDGCRDPETGELKPWAEKVIATLDSYAEVSPSGTGVKVLCRGRLPKWAGHRKDLSDGQRIEVYDRGQYFTLTGKALEPGKPVRGAQRKLETLCRKLWPEAEKSPELEDRPDAGSMELEDDELLEHARRARNGQKFSALYDHGSTSRYGSPSEADMDLCGMLAFWTGRDPQRMDRLFRGSALMRPKWEDRENYRRPTIERAIRGCKSVYRPHPPANPEITEMVRQLETFAAKDPWTGRGGPANRRAFGFLLNTGGALGRLRKGGIEVSIAERDLALAMGRARSNAAKSLDGLQDRKLIKILDRGGAKRPARILIRYSHKTGHIGKNPPEPPPVFNMARLLELLFKVRNPAPEMPEYDRNGRLIPRGKSPLVSPLGGIRSLMIEKVVWSPAGLTDSQIAERLERRPDAIKPLLPAILNAGLLVEDSGAYRAPPDLLERLEAELKRSGCNAAEHRDRQRYDREREARRRFVRESWQQNQDPESSGYVGELERVDLEPDPEEASADAPVLASVSEVFAMARERFNLPTPVEASPEPDKDPPAAFVASELNGVAGMRYREMLRRWKELGGEPAALEEAIKEGPCRFRREPLDFNQPYVYRAPNATRRESAA